MTVWRFLGFQYAPTSRPVDDWQRGLEMESFNRFSAVLEHLQVLPRNYWKRPHFDVLHGSQYHGMGEIIFKGDRKTYRVFGWFGPTRGEFTLLHASAKQRAKLTAEMELARQRRDLVITNGRRLTYDFTLQSGIDPEPEE
jgi:hypothetical protein